MSGDGIYAEYTCINRIRLEFKDRRSMEYLRKVLRINRIRLEFKGYMAAMLKGSQEVLIESDWNLKDVTQIELDSETYGINRIRLEFKVVCWHVVAGACGWY